MEKKTKTDYLVEYHLSKIKALTREKNGEDDRSLKYKLKEVAIEVGEFSLLAGLSNIIRSELPVKLTWVFCQLALLGKFIFERFTNL